MASQQLWILKYDCIPMTYFFLDNTEDLQRDVDAIMEWNEDLQMFFYLSVFTSRSQTKNNNWFCIL